MEWSGEKNGVMETSPLQELESKRAVYVVVWWSYSGSLDATNGVAASENNARQRIHLSMFQPRSSYVLQCSPLEFFEIGGSLGWSSEVIRIRH